MLAWIVYDVSSIEDTAYLSFFLKAQNSNTYNILGVNRE